MKHFQVGIFIMLLFAGNASYSKDYKGGEVQSKESFHYGRFETRFYASNLSGVLSTMFLFENNGWKKSDIWQEIDIEVFGKSPTNQWQSNLIWETDPAGPTKMAEKQHVMLNQRVNDWHTYALEWTPDYIAWFVDGFQVRRDTSEEALAVIGAKPMQIMFNIWSHTSVAWVGRFEELGLPTYQFIDYIRAYEWKGGDEFDKDPVFADEFENDLESWNISAHSFDENRVDFTKSNVFLRDGYLVLALCTEGNEELMRTACELPADPIVLEKRGIELYPNVVVKQLDLHEPIGLFKVIDGPVGQWKVYDEAQEEVLSGQGPVVSVVKLSRGTYLLDLGERKIQFTKPW